MEPVKVYLMRRNGRRNYEAQWRDPITGKLKTKTTGTHLQRSAERFAGALADKLNNGEAVNKLRTKFADAANQYEEQHLNGLAWKTKTKWLATRHRIVELIDPMYLSVLDSAAISGFQSTLRKLGLAEATIKGHLSCLRAFFRWCKPLGMIREVPHFAMPKRTGKMKGRPPTVEEFERIQSAIPKVLNCPELEAEWLFLARGLWWSGLRLEEALTLSWDDGDMQVVMTGKKPRLRIEANTDKSTKVRLLPLATEFVEMLQSVPEAQRTGPVFHVRAPGQITARIRSDTCSKMFVRFGEEAKVLVAQYPPRAGSDSTEPRKKWASAHDFRRAFGTRWARLLKPQQLKELMRHESIQTTMTFYVEVTAEEVEYAVSEHSHATNTSANNSCHPPAEHSTPPQ